MLAYLEALCAALLSGNAELVRELMAHPLGASLPESVRSEICAVLEQRGAAAPLQTLRFYHQTAHLLGHRRDQASRVILAPARRQREERQFELPLKMPVTA